MVKKRRYSGKKKGEKTNACEECHLVKDAKVHQSRRTQGTNLFDITSLHRLKEIECKSC